MARVIDRAMADILQKLEKATRGSRGGLDSSCIHGKLTNIQTKRLTISDKPSTIMQLFSLNTPLF